MKKMELIQRFIDIVNTVKNQKIQEAREKIGMIKLSSGRIVIFDKEDEAKVLKYNWIEQPDGYIISTSAGKTVDKTVISVHRFILNLTSNDKIEVDHINGIKWDNRKSNLRLATHRQNSQNKLLPKSNTSGVKGVYYCKQKDKGYPEWEKECWRARIRVNGKTYCKRFPYTDKGLTQASQWYDNQAEKYYKNFAKTNNMIQDQEKILAELNLIIQDVNLSVHFIPLGSTGYSNVRLIWNRKRNIKRYLAKIKINDEQYQKYFRYNLAGKILAAEFINQLLIQYSPNGKDDKRFNKIDYTVVTNKELQIEREYMNERNNKVKTSKYIGVLKVIKKYKNKNGMMHEKEYWLARIFYEKHYIYNKLFPLTDEGEKLAAKWYNEKAKELFGENTILNIID